MMMKMAARSTQTATAAGTKEASWRKRKMMTMTTKKNQVMEGR